MSIAVEAVPLSIATIDTQGKTIGDSPRRRHGGEAIKEADILYERGPYWVMRGPMFFEIYRTGVTHSVRVGQVGFSLGLSRCIQEIVRRLETDTAQAVGMSSCHTADCVAGNSVRQ